MQIIGIDGGGTKTKFTLFDEQMKELDVYVTGTSHFSQVGYEQMEARLREGIHYLVKKHQLQAYGIGYGLAGYGQEQSIRKKIEEVIERISQGHPYHLVNDVESAIAGALALQDGIMVIAGTGSIAFGVHGKERVRCGGWGYQIGDESSAYWLGRKLLAVFSKQADGRLEKSALYAIVMSACELKKDVDIISYVREVLQNDRTRIAGLARLVSEAAEQGDEQAKLMYEEAAVELALNISTIQRRVFPSGDVTVSYTGGVFQAGSLLLDPLQKRLPITCHLQAPIYGPDAGAALLLRQQLKQL